MKKLIKAPKLSMPHPEALKAPSLSKQMLIGLSLLLTLAALTLLASVPLPNSLQPITSAIAAEQAVKWTCPMHPHYIADQPGSCPICGMDLVKQSTETKKSSAENEQPVITIPAHTIQNMGVRTEKAAMARFGRDIRSFGIVKENERLRTEISARVEGWVEALNITAIGDEVKKGQQLFELFSPELIVSQRDYLTALRQGGQSRINITKRLTSFGVQQQALTLLEKNREVMQRLPFYAEQDGTVTLINITEGSYVKRGMTIARIQDFSTIWVIVNVSESDLPFIGQETMATVYFPNLPGRELKAQVDYIYPMVDAKTRTGQVRLILDNKNGELRPGAYADIVFHAEEERRLSIPAEAVLRDKTGDRVIISLGEGNFTSRQIDLGMISGGKAEVKYGLREGDEIVVSAQFLIDSESALRESLRKLGERQKPLNQIKPDQTHLAMIDHIIDASLYLHEALTKNEAIQPTQLDPALSLRAHLMPRYESTKLGPILEQSESALRAARNARTSKEMQDALGKLNETVKPWIMEGAPAHYRAKKLKLFMDHPTGKIWLQLGESPQNPYGKGHAMPVAWPEPVKPVKSEAEAKPAKAMKPQDPAADPHRGSHHNH